MKVFGSLKTKTNCISGLSTGGSKFRGRRKMMNYSRILSIGCIAILFACTLMISSLWGGESPFKNERVPTLAQWIKEKDTFDDPRPLLKGAGDPKNYLSPEVYSKVTFDIETMKTAWGEVVGFKAPDVVGKVAPEIKPGTYSYTDKNKFGFKDLMIPQHFRRFNPGASPHLGNFPELKIVPTRQYYWALPIAQATTKNAGRTKLNDAGYLVANTYDSGIPFPKPAGKFKAQQIVYNWVKRYLDGENNANIERAVSFDRKLTKDWDSTVIGKQIKGNGRVTLEPLGWYDERAKSRGEERFWSLLYSTPQDSAGNAIANVYFDDPSKLDQPLLYFAQVRRLRKLSSDDTQDPFPGVDHIMDDSEGFSQKLSPTRFPYKYEVIAEREYLVPSYTIDGSLYFKTKGVEMRNAEFERRPVYVLQLTSVSSNYLYSRRVLYIDRETFLLLHIENYDRKGRLYRTNESIWAFYPQQGMFGWHHNLGWDHVDMHSTLINIWANPFAYWVKREHTGMGQLMRTGK
jgi:hypothetical protein